MTRTKQIFDRYQKTHWIDLWSSHYELRPPVPLFNGIKLTRAENARKLGKTEREEQENQEGDRAEDGSGFK
ncbi:hypothetical protein NC651_014674 [Populus alba x Populus x berolinensis]|nr:hypothetical protein NC651_014674 [Populus alba x Populus x berolinensis]